MVREYAFQGRGVGKGADSINTNKNTGSLQGFPKFYIVNAGFCQLLLCGTNEPSLLSRKQGRFAKEFEEGTTLPHHLEFPSISLSVHH
jgi:hypothetical protein